MKKMKLFFLLVVLLASTGNLFAGNLTFTSNGPNYNISVVAEVTKYPDLTSTGQTLNFPNTTTLPSTQTINVPAFGFGSTYWKLTTLSFYANGEYVVFSETDLASTSQIHKSFSGAGWRCAIFLTPDGNGNYSFFVDCLVGP